MSVHLSRLVADTFVPAAVRPDMDRLRAVRRLLALLVPSDDHRAVRAFYCDAHTRYLRRLQRAGVDPNEADRIVAIAAEGAAR